MKINGKIDTFCLFRFAELRYNPRYDEGRIGGNDKMQAKKRDGGGLTVARVRTAGPGKYHDGNGTGLFLRVDPSGARFWIQRITIHGKRREIGLGSFPMIPLADARQAAMENKRLAYSVSAR